MIPTVGSRFGRRSLIVAAWDLNLGGREINFGVSLSSALSRGVDLGVMIFDLAEFKWVTQELGTPTAANKKMTV